VRADLWSAYLYLLLDTKHGIFKGYSQIVTEICATPWAGSPAISKSTKEFFKNISHIAKTREVLVSRTPTLNARMPKTIIGRPRGFIGQHLIGFVDFFESLSGLIIMVDIRMVLTRHSAISPFEILLGGFLIDF
jgi:hypothetical protein